jgi:hypothetical protein
MHGFGLGRRCGSSFGSSCGRRMVKRGGGMMYVMALLTSAVSCSLVLQMVSRSR